MCVGRGFEKAAYARSLKCWNLYVVHSTYCFSRYCCGEKYHKSGNKIHKKVGSPFFQGPVQVRIEIGTDDGSIDGWMDGLDWTPQPRLFFAFFLFVLSSHLSLSPTRKQP